jgi:DNA-binding MarR family transcriptional regulator
MMSNEMGATEVLIGESKASVLRLLLTAGGEQFSLSELARRCGVSKSTANAAVAALAQAGLVTDGRTGAGAELRIALRAEQRELVRSIMALDTAIAKPTVGDWAAVDAYGALLGANRDPRALVAELRARGVHADGIYRVVDQDADSGGHGLG